MAEENHIECVIYEKTQEVLFTFNPELKESFNEDFCLELEYHLCRTFYNSPDEEIYSLWCDGVMMPFDHVQVAKKNIISTEKIVTEAFIGPDGQDRYEMIIKLGPNSLDKFIKGLSLIDCLPGEESIKWIILDTQKKIIELQLL